MPETRAEKAQRLVDEGSLSLLFRESNYVRASVQSGDRIYNTVVYANGTFHCTCDWGQYHSYTDDLCAHALAVKLMTEKEKER